MLPELQAGFEAHCYALDREEAVAVIAQLKGLGIKRLQVASTARGRWSLAP